MGSEEQLSETGRTYVVAEGRLFVLGDNRSRSHNSASWTRPGSEGEDVPAAVLRAASLIEERLAS